MTLEFEFFPPSMFIDLHDKTLNQLFGHETKGLPLGCMIEILGLEQSGKSSLVYKLISLTQNKGLCSLIFDTDSSYNANIAELYNVDINSLLVSQTNDLRTIIKLISEIINKGIIDLIWIDSLSLANLKDERPIGNFSSNSPEVMKARYLDKVLMKFKKKIFDNNISIFFITYTNKLQGLNTKSNESKSLSLSCDIRVILKDSYFLSEDIPKHLYIQNICNKVGEPFIESKINIL